MALTIRRDTVTFPISGPWMIVAYRTQGSVIRDQEKRTTSRIEGRGNLFVDDNIHKRGDYLKNEEELSPKLPATDSWKLPTVTDEV